MLKQSVRRGYAVYRYGGEEFLAIPHEQSIEAAAEALYEGNEAGRNRVVA